MNWKFHMLFGALLGAFAAYFIFNFSGSALILFSLLSAASAILPDLDLRKSKASQMLYCAMLAIAILISYQNTLAKGKGIIDFALLAVIVCCVMLALDFLIRPAHRGITHSLLFLAAIFAVAFFLSGLFFASAICIGYASHLISDGHIKMA